MAVKFPLPFSSFDDAGDRVAPNPWTICDLRMQEISYELRSRPAWWTEYKNPQILAQWKAELLSKEDRIYGNGKLTEAEIDYLLAELAGYDMMGDETTGIQQSCFARVYESDTLIPEDLRQKFVVAVKYFEDVSAEQNNWRPPTNDQVLDLVDPSLYCGVYGRTLAYPLNKDSSNGGPKEAKQLNYETEAIHVRECPQWAASKRFTWIPTDFDLATGGQSAKALGYINNIHPSRHSDLHTIIEELVARFSLLWDRVLTDLHPDNPVPYRIENTYKWKESTDSAPYEDSFDHYDEWLHAMELWREERTSIRPTVPDGGYAKDISKREAVYSIKGRKLQVFVRICNIILTPENPIYLGESWHVEGMANERIVACGLFCYESENTTEPTLSVRTAITECHLIDYIWEDESGLFETYELASGAKGAQVLGSVKTLPGRSIAFPNIYQSRITPFELLDRSKPGYRRILALSLVDPECTIPSTTNISPQQTDWTREAIGTTGTLFAKLPMEILDMVEGAAHEGGMLKTRDEAEAYRLEVIEERKACVKHQNAHYFEKPLDFDADDSEDD
ncbi:hypothetical protein M407DRAFT_27424 [Tulasnella calospora MUT 4182]|uniref:Uncharacterized protein n=1 Tax=Tulasnella calospora MUT 4182 TaxID=1051891 RepID=A0A0C3LNV1_9AGAM|nr:hypothetical protein M407DRAFT_27424 [Tulasnella calospora MUT 4182]